MPQIVFIPIKSAPKKLPQNKVLHLSQNLLMNPIIKHGEEFSPIKDL